MQRSNAYTIIFTTAVTVVVGVILAVAYLALKDRIKENQLNEMKSNILSCVTRVPAGSNVGDVYESNIISLFVNEKGEVVKEAKFQDKVVTPESFDIAKAYKLKKKADKEGKSFDLLLPVYQFKSRIDSGKIEAYVLPMYGAGLWDDVWGYMALEGDFKTIRGVVFDHKAETPGLGARITNNKANTGKEDAFQERFKKKIISKEIKGETKYLTISKGEGNVFKEDVAPIMINGLSGASMTTKGVDDMLKNYIKLYQPYFAAAKKKMEEDAAKAGPVKEEQFNVEDDNKAVTH